MKSPKTSRQNGWSECNTFAACFFAIRALRQLSRRIEPLCSRWILMSQPTLLNYATPKTRAGHSPFGIASVCMALAIIAFSAGVLIWDDPFQSMGNDKPVRIGLTAGLLGIVLAIRALCDSNRKHILGTVGIMLNLMAMAGTAFFVPCL